MEVYWSGAAQRAGAAPSLSSYQGHSSLHRAHRRAARTVEPWSVDDDAERIQAQRKYQQRPEVKAMRRAAYLKRKRNTEQ